MEKQSENPAMPVALIKGDQGLRCVWWGETEYSKHPRDQKLSNSM